MRIGLFWLWFIQLTVLVLNTCSSILSVRLGSCKTALHVSSEFAGGITAFRDKTCGRVAFLIVAGCLKGSRQHWLTPVSSLIR